MSTGLLTDSASRREPTALDALAEAYFDARVSLSPFLATYLGVPGGEDRLEQPVGRGRLVC